MRLLTAGGVMFLIGCGMHRAPGPVPVAADAFHATSDDLRPIRDGMGTAEVQRLCGPPHAVEYGVTWRAFIVFLPLPDAWRYIYHYRGAGRVLFSCGMLNRDCGAIAVEPDPAEAG